MKNLTFTIILLPILTRWSNYIVEKWLIFLQIFDKCWRWTFKSVIVTAGCIETAEDIGKMLCEFRPKQLKASTPISISISIYKQTIISSTYLKYYYVGQHFYLYLLVEYLISYYTHTFQAISSQHNKARAVQWT